MTMRLVSSLLALPLLLAVVWAGGPSFAVAAGVGAALATNEYLRVVHPRPLMLRVIAMATSATLPILATLRDDGLELGFVVVIVASMLAWTLHLARRDNRAAEHGMGHFFTSIVLPAGGLAAVGALRAHQDGLGWASLVLVATLANDSMALFAGRAFGCHRLLPRVSPYKTWEGIIGGFVGSLLAIFIAGHLLFDDFTLTDIVVLTGITSIAGPVGDLSKSMIKRAHHLDDFGKLLPGHGGVLDRIDALVFNAPLVLLWVAWLRPA